jgi:hypothetical protein
MSVDAAGVVAMVARHSIQRRAALESMLILCVPDSRSLKHKVASVP